jgi:DNA-binding XRE family transcriptional regulator
MCTLPIQMPEPFEQLMADLRAWDATAEHGAQKALADQLGVARQTLNNWIKGRNAPSLKDGLKLQLFLKFQNGQSAVSRTRRG